jgi:hypothetical protein
MKLVHPSTGEATPRGWRAEEHSEERVDMIFFKILQRAVPVAAVI